MDWNSTKGAIFAVLVLLVAEALGPVSSAGQTPSSKALQSESSQVLVPVSVYDTRGDDLVVPGSDWRLIEKDLEAVDVRGLTAKDFRVKQDGVEQKVDGVKFESAPIWNYRDRSGYHTEIIGAGEGRWTTPEWNPQRHAWVSGAPRYVLAYTPPDSPAGSCHSISVHVDRKNTLVYAREKYCNIQHSPFDPLRGTKLGNEMERELLSTKSPNFRIGVAATSLFSVSRRPKVHITVEIPWRSLNPSGQEAVLGMVYSESHLLVTRFSDDAELLSDQIPARYETQLSLDPGQYSLRVVFRDGKKFGRSETPLTVGVEPQAGPAMSGIALCRQARIADSAIFETRSVSAELFPNDPSQGFHALLGGGLECIPAATPRFAAGEPVSAFFEVYDPQLAKEPTARVEAHIRVLHQGSGAVVFPDLSLDLAPFIEHGSPIVPVASEPFVNSLPPGRYRLEIRATDPSGRGTEWRAADFAIE